MSKQDDVPTESLRTDPDALARLVLAVADNDSVTSKVAEAEWNFSKCPKNQLPYCETYEYGRSSAAMIQRVAAWRREDHSQADSRVTSNYQLSAIQSMDFFQLFPEFPQTPWMNLDPSVVVQRLEALPERVPILVRSLPVDKLRDFGDYQDVVSVFEAYQTTTIQPMEINWFFHDKNLIEAFKEWLAANRPFPAKEKRGRTEPRVLLNALAAKRLLDHHSVNECQEITGMVLGTPLFRGDSNWYDAKAKAETHLAERLPPIPVEKFTKNIRVLFAEGFTEEEVNLLWQHLVYLKVSDATTLLRPKGAEFVAAMRGLLEKIRPR